MRLCVRARVSTGADKKANIRARVRGPGGLLEDLQRDVALEALGESGSPVGAELVEGETEKHGSRGGSLAKVKCQWALTQAIAQGAVTHSSEVTVLPLSPSQSFAMPSAV